MKNCNFEDESISDLSNQGCALLQHLSQLHTTQLGEERIRKNLSLETGDVVFWCRELIRSGQVTIRKQGKNWYVQSEDCVITVNASSYTIITAHRIRGPKEKPGFQKD